MKLAERSQAFDRYRHVRLNRPKVKNNMDKDRIQGSVEQTKGKVKEVAGKVIGDAKLETEGKTQETAGKIQNAVGGLKETLKEAVKD
jgi:uncharacterized protein YjbJ (UPF0337 family)